MCILQCFNVLISKVRKNKIWLWNGTSTERVFQLGFIIHTRNDHHLWNKFPKVEYSNKSRIMRGILNTCIINQNKTFIENTYILFISGNLRLQSSWRFLVSLIIITGEGLQIFTNLLGTHDWVKIHTNCTVRGTYIFKVITEDP